MVNYGILYPIYTKKFNILYCTGLESSINKITCFGRIRIKTTGNNLLNTL